MTVIAQEPTNPMNGDPSVRLIFAALLDLYDGYDVTVVAYPGEEARHIAATIVAIAKKMNVQCANVAVNCGVGPRVTFRAFESTDEIPLPTPKARVHIDHSAVFERQNVVPPKVRRVEA